MTFLFDIGRVLLDFDFESSLVRLLPEGTTDAAERLSLLLERKDEFEAGLIAVDAYVNWALEVLGSDATPAEFKKAWQQIFTPNLPMWDCVRELAAAGHRLILFSNINGIHCPWIFTRFPDFSLFDAGVLSFEVGAIKPHAAIYQHAIAHHGLVPNQTLYIDDLPQNIAAGRDFGFRCWQYDLAAHDAFEVWLASQMSSQI
ncbi:MAG: HAD family phosphatase [Akkermansiaceae bacterium]|nr:HAD family phosphatase [Akkermansiaceae bacterium]